MSFAIRKVRLEQFRKFRAPLTLDGLGSGLNIIIEPNETGKSTLLEALRAAFFVRHNTRNQLAQSFAPYGEAVGPEITVAFEVDGDEWSVQKRFLRGPSIAVTGPAGRSQGDEAEVRLNDLFGAVRDTSRNGDIANYGPLGLLWVAQTEALAVSAPGHIVRETVTSALETEVGSILGGEAYQKVRDRVDIQYQKYWSPSGQKRELQKAAQEQSDRAAEHLREVSERLVVLERTFSERDNLQLRLKVLQRELQDETDQVERENLLQSLEIARAAGQILKTRQAEQDTAKAKLQSLEDLKVRHQKAVQARDKATLSVDDIKARRSRTTEALIAAREKSIEARNALDLARKTWQEARHRLETAQTALLQNQRQAAIKLARQRFDDMLVLEEKSQNATALVALKIPSAQMAVLEACEQEKMKAQAVVNAGATRLVFRGNTGDILLDGMPVLIDDLALTRETILRFGSAEVLISPSKATLSADEQFLMATRKQKALLDELGVADIDAARARNENAHEAAATLRVLTAQMEALAPADERIDLTSGKDALRLFISTLGKNESLPVVEIPDIALLQRECEETEIAVSRAEGAQNSAIEVQRDLELRDTPLAVSEAQSVSELGSATAEINNIEERPEWKGLEVSLEQAKQQAVHASVLLSDAEKNASVYDALTINKKIETLDSRRKTALDSRNQLEKEIARLEGIIQSEGGLGLADQKIAADEELARARVTQTRVQQDADTYKLLRETLENARRETASKFVSPVTRRAKRYIDRLLPDCDLTFSDDLGLTGIKRNETEEICGNLSRGTQEQLAVLTRIAFAELLLEQGKPVSLILDDPFVYSDDARLDTMIEILTEVSEKMQVIVLTCRDRAFRHLTDARLVMSDEFNNGLMEQSI